jgi:hypothetical protein
VARTLAIAEPGAAGPKPCMSAAMKESRVARSGSSGLPIAVGTGSGGRPHVGTTLATQVTARRGPLARAGSWMPPQCATWPPHMSSVPAETSSGMPSSSRMGPAFEAALSWLVGIR